MSNGIIYNGLFLTKESEEALFNRGNLLKKKQQDLHVTFEYNPRKCFPSGVLGEKYKIKVVAEGKSHTHHGYLVEIPEQLKAFYNGARKTHITVSLIGRQAKAKNTVNLKFEPITPFELEGTMGHFTTSKRVSFGGTKKENKKESKQHNNVSHSKEVSYPKILLVNNENKFVFKTGFASADILIAQAETFGLTKSKYYIVEIKKEYFGICFEGWSKQVLLAKENFYVRGTNGLFRELDYKSDTLPYEIKSRRRIHCKNFLAKEMLTYDDELKVHYFTNVNSKALKTLEDPLDAHNYLIILGALSFNYFYPRNEAYSLKDYFVQTKNYTRLYSNNIIAINPFKQQVMTRYGVVKNFVYLPGSSFAPGSYNIRN